MNIVKLAAAAAIALSSFSLPAAAEAAAQPPRDQYEHHDRTVRDDSGRHSGWERGRHHGWRNHHRRYRVCRWTWRHHHRVRICRWRYRR
jgi:Ni/Co efflux regulator RcnB